MIDSPSNSELIAMHAEGVGLPRKLKRQAAAMVADLVATELPPMGLSRFSAHRSELYRLRDEVDRLTRDNENLSARNMLLEQMVRRERRGKNAA